MRILFFIFLLQLGTASRAQTVKSTSIIMPEISYDTTYLKNGTQLIFMTNDEKRSIRMVNTVIDTTIRSVSIKHPESAIGFLMADFENYFILSCRQNEFKYMWIYDKKTVLIIGEGDVMAFDTTQKILCYADWNKPYTINLFDFSNSKYEKYISPLVPCSHWWYCIQITGINEKQITIQYTGMSNVKKEIKYPR